MTAAPRTLVQIERTAISPLLYVLWLATQYLLTQSRVSREWATVIGFCVAVGAARSLHTIWMLRTERNRAAREVAKQPPDASAAMGGRPAGGPATPLARSVAESKHSATAPTGPRLSPSTRTD